MIKIMSKINGPLFSIDAYGTIGKSLSYSKKKQTNIVSKYSKPGDVSPGESSPRQKDQRSIIRLITIHWQCMDDIDRITWETAAKAARFKGSGYHYFLHMAQTDLLTYLGLAGFWSMNYNIGDKIPDLSGNNNHGTLSPIFPCDSPTLVDSFNKKQGKAAKFDGITGFINCGNDLSLKPSNFITIEAVLKTTSIVNQVFLGLDSNHKYFGTISPNLFYINFYTTLLDQSWAPALPISFNDNKYHQYVCTYNSTDGFLSAYFDGKYLDHKYYGGAIFISPAYNISISGRMGGSSMLFDGNIDEVLIFNTILSPSEIFKHYQSYNLP